MRSRNLLNLALIALLAAFTHARPPEPTRWALLIGISDYIHFDDEVGGDLPGAANDARNLRDVLVARYGFPEEHVRLLLDADATREGIERAFREWLVANARPGDLVFFGFAGHGSQTWDLDADEEDGLDETFCPADVMRGSTDKDVTDDEFAAWLRELPTENVVIYWDKCHAESSTRAVTPFARPRSLGRDVQTDVPRPEGATEEAQPMAPGERSLDQVADHVLELSASQADEVAIDAAWPGENGGAMTYGGAFTTNFVRNLWEASENATYEEIFRRTVQDLRRQRFAQKPGISGSELRLLPLFGLAAGAPARAEDAATPAPAVAAATDEAAAGAKAAETPEEEAGGYAPILGVAGGNAELGGGQAAGMTEGSIYRVGERLLRVVDVDPDRALAEVVEIATRGISVGARDSLAAGSRARLIAYRYPPAILRVSVADLPGAAREALREALWTIPTLQRVEAPDAFAHLIVRAREDNYVVLGMDGSTRHLVPAPTAAAGAAALAPLLRAEFGAHQIAALDNPARPIPLAFEFAGGKDRLRLGDEISFRVRAGRDGYVTIVDLNTDGNVQVIFPNPYDDDNFLRAGEELVIPTEATFTASPPTGRGMLRVFLTERPLVLPFAEEDASRADQLLQALRNAAGRPPVSGSDAIPVGNWTTASVVYEIAQ